jgi:hypothetical protein
VLTKDQGQLLAGTLGALKANSKTDRELVKAIREKLNCFLSIPVLQQALQLIPGLAAFSDRAAGVRAGPEGGSRAAFF